MLQRGILERKEVKMEVQRWNGLQKENEPTQKGRPESLKDC